MGTGTTGTSRTAEQVFPQMGTAMQYDGELFLVQRMKPQIENGWEQVTLTLVRQITPGARLPAAQFGIQGAEAGYLERSWAGVQREKESGILDGKGADLGPTPKLTISGPPNLSHLPPEVAAEIQKSMQGPPAGSPAATGLPAVPGSPHSGATPRAKAAKAAAEPQGGEVAVLDADEKTITVQVVVTCEILDDGNAASRASQLAESLDETARFWASPDGAVSSRLIAGS